MAKINAYHRSIGGNLASHPAAKLSGVTAGDKALEAAEKVLREMKERGSSEIAIRKAETMVALIRAKTETN